MPTGIGNGIAGDVFQNNLGAGGGGGLVCPSRYSWLGDGINNFGQQAGTVYTLGAVNSSLSFWYKPIDIKGAAGLGAGLLTTDGINLTSTDSFNIYTSASGVLTASLGPMIFPAHPELITNGSFSEVPVGTELIDNPTFSDAASITPWQITGSPNATIEPWEPRFMRIEYTVTSGPALFHGSMGQPLNTMYSVKMRVRGVTSAGADQGSTFAFIGDSTALTSANIISNPTLTYDYQDYEFRVWSTDTVFRFYIASAAIGDVVDFDSISVKPLDMVVDNGNFSSLGADWTVIDNAAGDTVTFGGSSATFTKTVPEAVYLQQDYPVTLGASHKLTYTVLSNTFTGSGTELGLSSLSAYGQSTIPSSVGTHTVYLIVTLDTPAAALRFYSNDTGGSLEITDVSIEELGEDWTLFPNVEPIFNASGLTLTTANGNDQTLHNQDVVDSGKSYKVTYEITAATYTTGSVLKYYDGDSYVAFPEQGVGPHTFYYTAENPSLSNWYMKLTRGTGTDTVTISSVSVEEVLSEDEWHHLALSVDRDSEWKWYVDGVLTNTMDNATDIAPLLGISTLGLTNVSTAIASFYGNMTEPSLWNIPLSSSEVKDIYDNMYGGQKCLGVLPFSSDLITNGKFNQIGPELVSNPNFTDTGSELIVDGGFPNGSTDWNLLNGGTIVDNEMQLDCGGTTDAYTYQSKATSYTSGKSYKLTVKIVSNTTGTDLLLYSGGTSPNAANISIGTTADTYTIYFVADYTSGTGKTIILRALSSTGIVVIDDVSIKELGEGWNIGMSDGSAQTATKYAEILASGCRIVSDDTATPYVRVLQTALEIGKNYKGSVSVTNSDTGEIRANLGGVNSGSFIDGSNTFYASNTSTSSISFVRNANDVDTTFTHVSAKEVGQGWTAITTTGGTVTFPEGMARIQVDATVGNNAYISQLGVMEIGKSYTMTYRIVSNNGGSLYTSSGVTNPALPSTVGSHEITFTSDNTTLNIARAVDNTDVSITNVTLTQVGGGNLERWWRMNGTEPLLIDLPNVAPNGIVDDLNEINSPGISPDVP